MFITCIKISSIYLEVGILVKSETTEIYNEMNL